MASYPADCDQATAVCDGLTSSPTGKFLSTLALPLPFSQRRSRSPSGMGMADRMQEDSDWLPLLFTCRRKP
jgi:hypothetical protein